VLCPAALWPYEATLNDSTGDLSLQEVVDTVQEVIVYAKSHGAKVVPWIGDTMRGSTASACVIARGMVEAGADGVYLVDSRGNSHPIATRRLVRKVREAIGDDVRLYVQHHNDLGVATANALADAEAGADWIDCTVLGIGDRGGTVAFEEAACLFEMYGIKTNINLEGLYDLCCYVRDAFGVALPAWKPIAGDNWNKEEGKGHLEGAHFSEASFGLAPEAVGRKMEMVIGGKILFGKERSSLWTDEPVFVKGVLADWGLTVDQTQLERIILRAQAAVATTRPRFYLTFDEFRTIVDGVL
jgi:isopropylmalate/homocitrate/citramalate synthase